MKKLLSLLLIICSIGVAYADDKSTVTSLKYVDDQLNTRQDKFGANDGKAMTFTNVAGGNAPRDVKTNLGSNTSDTGLPTVSAVNTGLDDKQNTISAVNTNTVITYTGVEGQIGQKGIYQDTGTYAAQSDNLIDAGTFNAALRNGLENEFVCADRDPVTGNCWLYTIDNETAETIHGKNLFDNVMEFGNINASGAPLGDSKAYLRSVNFTPVTPLTNYVYKCNNANGATQAYYLLYRSDYTIISRTSAYGALGASGTVFTTPSDASFIKVFIYKGNGLFWDEVFDPQIQLELGSTATAYEPYVGETVNVYIPQNQTAQNP